MDSCMVANLLRADYTVTVNNRTPENLLVPTPMAILLHNRSLSMFAQVSDRLDRSALGQ